MERKEFSITSSSFIYRVLMSLHHLQGIPEFHEGVKLKDLTTYVRANCLSDGDIPNQIETALFHALNLGYVRKFNNQYQVIVSSAKIQQVPCGSLEQTQEITRIQSIFSTNWLSGKSFESYVQKERSLKIMDNVKSDEPEQIENEVDPLKNPSITTPSINKKITVKSNKRPKTLNDHSSNSSSPSSNSSVEIRNKRRKKEKKKRRKNAAV